MQAQILTPAAVLVLWSLVMLFWMGFTRLPALKSMGGIGKARPGGRGQDLEGVLAPEINWKSHNYSHLMEQPTLFYATVAILAIMGPGSLDVALAWAYVVIRIIHSVWQATINRLPVRFSLFVLSSFCLIVLAIRALGATLGHG